MMSHSSSQAPALLPRQQLAKPELTGMVYLFEITMGPQSVLRVIDHQLAAEAVGFAGHVYNLFSVTAHGFSWSADGPPTRPLLYLSNQTGQFSSEIYQDRLRGNSVRRIITLAAELDPPHGQGGGNCFSLESWVIHRLVQLDDEILRLELATEASFEGRQFPQRVMLRDLCQHSYRRWDARRAEFSYERTTCPYVGAQYFTASGRPTRDPAEDVCSLHLKTGCKKRFAGDLPFLGFPGVRRL